MRPDAPRSTWLADHDRITRLLLALASLAILGLVFAYSLLFSRYVLAA